MKENMKKNIGSLVVLVVFGILAAGSFDTETEVKKDDNAFIDTKPKVEDKNDREVVIEADPKIVCDRFELVAEITNATLALSIDTDLPDNTVVMVSVSRIYLTKGDTETYIESYFSERSTIGKWRLKHSISLASEDWEKTLRETQERLSRIGLGFEVISISDMVEVGMVVPVNQPDPKFGHRNKNLTGKAVEIDGPLRIVRDEIEFNYPLEAPSVKKSPVPSLHPEQLEIGRAYVVSKQTPLMPSHSPDDPIAAMQLVKQIPEGGGFKIIEVYKGKVNPWYKVIAFDQNTEEIGRGWINSVALYGQQLKVH